MGIEEQVSMVARDGMTLSDSAFLADLGPHDRSIWRLLATLTGGGAAGLAMGLMLGGLALLAFVILTNLGHFDATQLPTQIQTLIGDDGKTLPSALLIMLLAATTNVPMFVGFVAIAAVLTHHRLHDYFTASPHFRWRLLLGGLILSAAVVAPMAFVGSSSDGISAAAPLLSLATTPASRLLYAVASIGLLIPAAAAEEVFFRGWLLRQTAAVAPVPWFAMAVNGLTFSSVHGDFVPVIGLAVGGIAGLAIADRLASGDGQSAALARIVFGVVGAALVGWATYAVAGWRGDPVAFTTRAVMGAGFAYMTLRLGGLEFSIGAHAANNILIVLFLQPLTLKAAAASSMSLDSEVGDLLLALGYVVITELVVRWPPLRRLCGLEPEGALGEGASQPHPG